MKALKLIVFSLLVFFVSSTQAQVSIKINFGTPPQWGPVGYTHVRYYYLPDVESYYDVQSSQFIYYQGGVWVHRSYLPARYRNYDLYRGYKVVLTDYHGSTPYNHYKEHRTKYYKGYHGKYQQTNGRRPEKTYSKKPQQHKNVGQNNNHHNSQNSNNENHNKGKSENHGNDKGEHSKSNNGGHKK
ncbi:MAG: hypothetical protein AUJ98_03795 [Bacteroidetes bacterium CG2_30_33_31]|nr:MAG: hypothetical protein AUJ98_03795 [Bacteroidetes bacterium CG2_30_33_31]